MTGCHDVADGTSEPAFAAPVVRVSNGAPPSRVTTYSFHGESVPAAGTGAAPTMRVPSGEKRRPYDEPLRAGASIRWGLLPSGFTKYPSYGPPSL